MVRESALVEGYQSVFIPSFASEIVGLVEETSLQQCPYYRGQITALTRYEN